MKVLEGKLVEKPEKEWEVPFDITLDELRKKRKRELFTKYAEKCEEGVEFEGSKFQTSERSANRIGLVLQDWIRGIPISYWVRKDNSHHEITSYPQIDSLAIAISKKWRFLLHINTTLRDEIDSLSPNELLSLDVSSRWQEIEEKISE
ncbi:hypothetical protein [Leptospira stimsonii]|nr:hypothetical protein [Leptospira stimsonii]